MARRVKQTKKVAVVTGGGTGLGRDAANRLTRDGFAVAVIGRRANRLKPRRGETLHPYVCDVAEVGEIKETVKGILRDLGRIDVLVNNAGVVRRELAEDVTQENLNFTIGVNLLGTMNFSLACLPALKKTKGSIINISSSLTYCPAPEYLAYCASKGGVDAFTKALAVELAPHRIRVNAISPSLVRSEILQPDGMSKREYDANFKRLGKTYFLLGRSGEPEDVSALISYLASDDSSWMTGVNIPLDGGESVGSASRFAG